MSSVITHKQSEDHHHRHHHSLINSRRAQNLTMQGILTHDWSERDDLILSHTSRLALLRLRLWEDLLCVFVYDQQQPVFIFTANQFQLYIPNRWTTLGCGHEYFKAYNKLKHQCPVRERCHMCKTIRNQNNDGRIMSLSPRRVLLNVISITRHSRGHSALAFEMILNIYWCSWIWGETHDPSTILWTLRCFYMWAIPRINCGTLHLLPMICWHFRYIWLFHVFSADKWANTSMERLSGSRRNTDTTGCLGSTGTWRCLRKYFVLRKMVITPDQAGNSKQMSLISYPSLLQNQHGIHMKDPGAAFHSFQIVKVSILWQVLVWTRGPKSLLSEALPPPAPRLR